MQRWSMRAKTGKNNGVNMCTISLGHIQISIGKIIFTETNLPASLWPGKIILYDA